MTPFHSINASNNEMMKRVIPIILRSRRFTTITNQLNIFFSK